jgi:3-hydroxybutyryl-CoA dehydrogenase
MSGVNRPVVGVIGAGVMGTGVAQSLAQAGHAVVLVDVDERQLANAKRTIPKGVRLRTLLDRTGGDSASDVLARITFTADHGALEAVEFVIENVTEDWETKRALYRQIDAICGPRVPFGVNTSAIPITRVAAVTARAARVVGMHFMNPVPVMPMVELVRGYHTSDATLEAATALVRGMGKDAIVVADAPGFVTNRVMMLMVNEAMFLLQDGTASAADIDRLFKTCCGHKMGPLETADLIGLDTVLRSLEVIQGAFADSKYRPCPLLVKMVDAGLLGRKTGRGFHRYDLN